MNKRALRLLIGITALIVASLLSLYCKYQTGKQLPEGAVRVVEVHDGDTISIILGNKEKE